MIDEIYWSGDSKTGGYRVSYQPISEYPIVLQSTPKEEIMGIEVTRKFDTRKKTD